MELTPGDTGRKVKLHYNSEDNIMYDTYKQAKLANPDSEIVTTGSKWGGRESLTGNFMVKDGTHNMCDDAWVICNPADHCETLTQFEKAGKALETGDKVIIKGVSGVTTVNAPLLWSNGEIPGAEEIYILDAAADKVETPEEREAFESMTATNWPQPGDKVTTSLGAGEFVAKVIEYDVTAYIVQFDDNWEAFTIDGLKPYDQDYENGKALYELATSLLPNDLSKQPFEKEGRDKEFWIELAKRVEIKHD